MVKLNRFLKEEKKEFDLSKQVLRSGTSIGANIAESEHAESRADFVHKLSVSLKEAYETEFWLNLLCDGEYISPAHAESMIVDCNELERLLIASINTAKRKMTGYKGRE